MMRIRTDRARIVSMTTLPAPRFLDPHDAPTLRWGIIGPGSIAGKFVDSLQANSDQVAVAAASHSASRAKAFASRYGIERSYDSYVALLADPDVDVAYIATTHNTHEELALLAIEAGKPVLIEKPIATTAAGGQRIADAARAAGVFAMEAMWTRYLPHIDVIRQLLETHALGDVRIVTADFGIAVPFDVEHRLYNPTTAGGALLDLGVYPVQFARLALPQLLTSATVHAYGTLARSGVDETATLVIETDGDAQAILNCSVAIKTPTVGAINGTAGRIVTGAPFHTAVDVTYFPEDGDPSTYRSPKWAHGPESRGMAFEAAAFARYLTDGLTDSPLFGLNEAIASLRILDEAREQLGVQTG